jgi:high-affinity iron transporter
MYLLLKLAAGVSFLVGLIAGSCAPVLAQSASDSAQTAWRLLDYLSVDYGSAVANGQVINPSEYDEMVEFAAQVRVHLTKLPSTPAQPSLIDQSEALRRAIERKASPAEIADLAKRLESDLLTAYPVPLVPSKPPDLARGAALYQQQCAACHGTTGAGDGPNAKGLEPPPIAFADMDRARRRSLFGLYQVISQGLDGTAMASFAQLPSEDRWALAFYAGTLAFSDAEAAKGVQLWESDPALRQKVPNLQTLVQTSPADLTQAVGEDKAIALIAYLRRHPDATTSPAGSALAIARTKLMESVAAYEAGDRRRATDRALSAYLDGFEPVEPSLKARDNALMTRIETAMGEFRAAIGKGEAARDLRDKAERLVALLDAAQRALAPEEGSSSSTFVAAFTVLLREGLEALLIVVAMVAFLRKAERTDVLPYVHGGWVAALAAGGLTWVAATYMISISGASRELTEGLGSLIAAVVLVSVGLWMHGKARAEVWQKYVRDKLSRALSGRSAWFLFLLAFVVVYREVFETILFYAALWSQGTGLAMLAGAATGAVTLAITAWALLTYSRRLPITRFFSVSSILIAVLAVVLAGKGIAALQEAGLLDILPITALPRVEMLGIFPTRETLIAQVLTLIVMLVGFWYTSRTPAERRKDNTD